MRLTTILAVVFSFWLPTIAPGQNVVVELFTSQGCSSCPPADRVLQKLAREDDVIVLGWHVDYWDYLGWKDEFSRPENTARQMGYRHRWDLRSLYTPQAVIHGEAQIVGSNERKVRMYVTQFQSEKPMLDLKTRMSGDRAHVTISAIASGLPASDIFLVQIVPEVTTDILRGENGGKSVNYVNIVEDMTLLGNWDGRRPAELSASIDSSKTYVILVQAKDFGPILGAEWVN